MTTRASPELTLVEVSRRIAAREVSPTELVEAALGQIDRLDSKLLAFVTVCEENARREATQLAVEQAAGRLRGPLHGVPLGIKDLIDTAGIKTTSSSKVRADYVPALDATVVERLKAAGGIVIGKTNTHEFAFGIVSPPTRNAWSTEHIPGGSSGGSAVAVAAGMCTAAVGSDTGGSIRIPAAFNGIVGLKPTYGRVPKSGVAALSWSLDHVGPMTRTVVDAALMLGVMAGRAREDPTSAREPVDDYAEALNQPIRSLRLGVPRNYFHEEIDPDVLAAVDEAARTLESLGARLVDVDIENIELSLVAEFAIIRSEASSYHQADLRRSADLYGPAVRSRLEIGELHFGTHYVNAQRARTLVKEAFRACFTHARLDALLVPTVPMTAPLHVHGGEKLLAERLIRYCAPFNLSGQPVLTVPCGIGSDGLPIGLAIVGRPFDEALVLQIGHAYEQSTEWSRRTSLNLEQSWAPSD